MITEEEDRVRDRPDLPLGRLDEPEPHVARNELDAVEVARDVPVGSQNDDPRRVRVLTGFGIERVPETDRARERLDGLLLACQEVPRAGRAFVRVGPDIGLLLGLRERGAFLRIDAHRDNVEVLAGLQHDRPQTTHEPVERQRAEHRALVVVERQDDGFRAKVIPELDVAAGLVLERQVEGHGGPELLVDPDFLEDLRAIVLGRAGDWRT